MKYQWIYKHTSFHSRYNNSPLSRACMEDEETAAHVIMVCPEMAEHRARYLGSPRSLSEVVGNIKGLLGFPKQLGWHECHAKQAQ